MTKEQSNILKGIAITMVVVCHFGNALGTRITTPLGGIGVAIFLFISGYGLSKSYIVSYYKSGKGLQGYWRKRLIGVCVPYTIFEMLTWKIQSGGVPFSILCLTCY